MITTTSLHTLEEEFLPIDESLHWQCKLGELQLQLIDIELIQEYHRELALLLRLVIKIYIQCLTQNKMNLSKDIISYFPFFIDPYLPGICLEQGIDNSKDEFLDRIDID